MLEAARRPALLERVLLLCGVVRTRNSARMMLCIAHEPEIWAARREGGEPHPAFLAAIRGAQKCSADARRARADRDRSGKESKGWNKKFLGSLFTHTTISRAQAARWPSTVVLFVVV